MASSHSWSRKVHSWQAEDGADPDDSDVEEIDPEDAGAQLLDLLVDLKVQGKLSATNCCLISFWAARAGAAGGVQQLGKAPGASSGHYSSHFDKVIGHRESEKDLLWVDIPCYRPFDAGRYVRQVPVFPPHEILAEECAGDKGLIRQLKGSVDAGEWPPCYHSHPVVQQAKPAIAIPIAIYIDGIQFTRRDNILGVFCNNLATGVHHLVAVLRKSWMCRCGCRGWCSLYPLLETISWSLKAAARGVYPDAGPFGDLDPVRKEFSNSPLGLVAACLFLKADWAEYAHTLGFFTWSSKRRPCVFCDCNGQPWVTSTGFDAISWPWNLTSFEQYKAACVVCERWVNIRTKAELDLVRGLLFFDKRKAGVRGRCLQADIADLGLLKGDRLEVHLGMPDVCGLEALQAPCRLLFWRESSETLTHRRCPLFDDTVIHLIPETTFALDWLHLLSLGVFQTYIGIVVNLLLEHDCWKTRERTEDSISAMSVRLLAAELEAWYRSESGKHATKIDGLKASMFGTRARPQCSLRGAETNGLLEFLVAIALPKFSGIPNHADVLSAGVCLTSILQLIRANSRMFTVRQVQTFTDCVKRYIDLCQKLEWAAKPKDHNLMHMAQRILIMGSPALYGNWFDETLNKELKGIAAKAHATVWEPRILSEFRRSRGLGVGEGAVKRRRR